MSCELVGVAAAEGDMDLEDLRETVGVFQRCASATIGRHDGFIARHLGNSVLVLFGYPRPTKTTPSERSAPGSNCVRRSGP